MPLLTVGIILVVSVAVNLLITLPTLIIHSHGIIFSIIMAIAGLTWWTGHGGLMV